MERRKTRKVRLGNVCIGGMCPITVQSMTNTDTRDASSTINQIKELEKAKCDIVRVAVPDMQSADAIRMIKKNIHIPLVADIHFDYRLAIASIENGVDGIRINPGNIGSEEKIKSVIDAAKYKGIPIRIGVNSGSLEKDILSKHGKVTSEGLIESALRHVSILEKYGFYDIVISIKSASVPMMIDSYRLISQKVDYPLHLGVTEAGTKEIGTIKSSIGIGTLLSEGIGDTIRVSLTGNPLDEVKVGRHILKSLGIIKDGINFISCPTCGRTDVDLIKIADEVEKRLEGIDKNIKVAVMGCVVNGPGEAREADIGLAGGHKECLIFKKGKPIRKVPEDMAVDELMKEINNL